ncbi:unnamed protein product [Urochloa humidicola]
MNWWPVAPGRPISGEPSPWEHQRRLYCDLLAGLGTWAGRMEKIVAGSSWTGASATPPSRGGFLLPGDMLVD